MRLVLLGAPGSGKGTQAARLKEHLQVPHISTGDLLRAEVAAGTKLGLEAKAVMDAGNLVSDEILLGMLEDRFSRPDTAGGFILDGYPRNVAQCEALERLLARIGQPLDIAVKLKVPSELIVDRIAGRAAAEGRKDDTFAALARLSAKAAAYPDLNLRLRPIQDLPSGGGGGGNQGAQYEVSLQGDNLDELQVWLPRLVKALAKNPMFQDVASDVEDGGLRQNIVVDRDQASRLGISMGNIDSALYDAFGQRQVSTIYSDINQYKVVVNALPSQTATPEALNRIYVRNNSGAMVPITAVAHQEPGLAPSQIRHANQMTTMDLSFNLAPGKSMGEALPVIQQAVQDLRMPGDIRLSLGDDFRRFQQSQSDMLWLILAAIVTVYIVLGMLYESLIHPITILSTLPAAGVGALAALVITNTELSVVAMIALVLLIGIVKKNAIMMIDFALVAQRVHGKSPVEAAREACVVRFRPIMMTTMVAILAALPLAIGLGEGSELRRPLGIAMIGGLLISQSLTLLSTPALYVIFSCLADHWKSWRARRREKKAARQAATAVAKPQH